MIDLKETAIEINEILEKRRREIELSFIEEGHIYYMRDLNGKLRDDFLSVSPIVGKFYEHFDDVGKALQKSNGDVVKQQILLNEWKAAGDYATNMGSRVHYELEKYLVDKYKINKEVREPIFTCDETQINKSNNMIIAGKKFLSLMEERKCYPIDTEAVLGSPELGYVGQADNPWIISVNNEVMLMITDYKSNKPENFEIKPWTTQMYYPFEEYPSTALYHYHLQLPLYAKLLIDMLKGSKYENIKLAGCIVVSLRDSCEFVEYRTPRYFYDTILKMNIKEYIN